MPADPAQDPKTLSVDAEMMRPYLELAQALQSGAEAMRLAGEKYLPKYSGELDSVYETRRKVAKLTNIFMDIVESLSLKPFSETVKLGDGTPETILEHIENVDGFGTTLHMFMHASFQAALRDGIAWIMVDWPEVEEMTRPLTKAETDRMGLRPIWSRIKAIDVLDVRSDSFGQKEMITHFRMCEMVHETNQFETKLVKQIKIYRQNTPDEFPTWETWRENEDGDWAIYLDAQEMTISKIPIVPLMLGRRVGMSWYIDPPMKAAADLQVELYQEENNLKNVRTLTAFPMLAANGVTPPEGGDGMPQAVVVGPSATLYGGEKGSWSYVEPSGNSLNFLKESIKDTIRELRELGRQPLTAQSGQMTVVTTAAIAQKGNSALQAWAIIAGLTFENVLGLAAEWMGIEVDKIDVQVFDDFDTAVDDPNFAHILTMAERGLISREQVIEEAMRRGIIGARYDMNEDLEKIENDVVRMMPDLVASEDDTMNDINKEVTNNAIV